MTASAGVLRFGMGERRQPGLGRSFVLAFVVHAVLFSAMFLGVRWQSHDPEVVTVELWEAPPPPPPVVKPEPKVEAPKPEPAPPPPVVAKPEPKVEKPDITIKDREKPKPKPKPEPKKAEVKKPEPPKRDLEFERRLREQAALEQQALAEQQRIAEAQRREREMKALIARQQADAKAKALAVWRESIRVSIRGRMLESVVSEVPGNPEAIFDVTILPSGDVINVRRRKSSGHPRYDAEIERAIRASTPLPKPADMAVFERELELKFRPDDK
jgi:colicin import membrane protein